MMKTIKIDKTRSCTVDTEKTTIYPSVEAWQAEAEKRFGKDYMNWKFQCPMCGHIASIADFKAAGAKSPNCAYQECIGRYTGKGSPKEGDSSGCNWAAYGLFGIPNGKGVFVMTGNEEGQEIFDYAPAQGEEE